MSNAGIIVTHEALQPTNELQRAGCILVIVADLPSAAYTPGRILCPAAVHVIDHDDGIDVPIVGHCDLVCLVRFQIDFYGTAAQCLREGITAVSSTNRDVPCPIVFCRPSADYLSPTCLVIGHDSLCLRQCDGRGPGVVVGCFRTHGNGPGAGAGAAGRS